MAEGLYGGNRATAASTGENADGLAGLADDGLEPDIERVKDLASEAPVIRLVNQLIARASERRTSDIHTEPFEDRVRVRCCIKLAVRGRPIDLRIATVPALHGESVVIRMLDQKSMALDFAALRLAADGRNASSVEAPGLVPS